MNRVALYMEGAKLRSEDLMRCARQAEANGERVVTMVSERPSPRLVSGVGGPLLRRLVERMEADEFDAIVANFGSRGQGGIVRLSRTPVQEPSKARVVDALPPPGGTAAIYARSATRLQDDGSIQNQVDVCGDYAAENRLGVAGIYSDAGASGTTTVGRQGWSDLLAAAKLGALQVVLVEDLDRLSRNARELNVMVRDLEELDVAVRTISGALVSDMELAFKAVQDAHYRKQIGEKIRRPRVAKARLQQIGAGA